MFNTSNVLLHDYYSSLRTSHTYLCPLMRHAFVSYSIHVIAVYLTASFRGWDLRTFAWCELHLSLYKCPLYSPVCLYHFNCLSEQDLLWIMGMINLIEIFPLSTPKPQVGKEKNKYFPSVFHLVPVSVSMYETTVRSSEGCIVNCMFLHFNWFMLMNDWWEWMCFIIPFNI